MSVNQSSLSTHLKSGCSGRPFQSLDVQRCGPKTAEPEVFVAIHEIWTKPQE